MTVDVTVANTGTRSLSSVAVALFYEVSPGGPFRLASTLNVPLDPGASEVVRLSWVANRSGTVPLELRVDPDNVLSETNEDDNILATSVDVTASTLPNLSVAAADITSIPASLAEGMSATLKAVVRNLGDGAATPFEVRFYVGDPARDGLGLGASHWLGRDRRRPGPRRHGGVGRLGSRERSWRNAPLRRGRLGRCRRGDRRARQSDLPRRRHRRASGLARDDGPASDVASVRALGESVSIEASFTNAGISRRPDGGRDSSRRIRRRVR